MSDVSDLIAYYANLLIIQYHDQPKAQATIELITEVMLANNILLDIQNAYDVDTAVGAQLDVIGKYVGVDRYYSELELSNYFSMVDYSQAGSLPSSPPQWGFCNYSNFSSFAYNGSLDYADIITVSNALNDDSYRFLIRLKIILNNINYSHQQIDEEMWNAFGATLRPESAGGMEMLYFISSELTSLIQAIVAKNLLPKPMGVGLLTVTGVTGDMFALTDYAGHESPFGDGLIDYASFAATPGQILNYSQIN